jgi:hypothetical protein
MWGLETLMTGCTTFVIAHRLSTVRRADTILVLKDGRIAEQGPFTECSPTVGHSPRSIGRSSRTRIAPAPIVHNARQVAPEAMNIVLFEGQRGGGFNCFLYPLFLLKADG